MPKATALTVTADEALSTSNDFFPRPPFLSASRSMSAAISQVVIHSSTSSGVMVPPSSEVTVEALECL